MLHFIRPYWLALFAPLFLYAWYLYRRSSSYGEWEKVCDAELLSYLLIEKVNNKMPFWFILTSLLLLIIALSGPAWKKLPTPVFRNENTRIILMHMGQSLYAQDLKPSRLIRTRYKVIDLLKHVKEGQTGLIVFADEPYVVAPITEDTNTLINLVPVLDPTLIPQPAISMKVEGRPNIALALKKAQALLDQTGQTRGTIILLTDQNASAEDIKTAKKLSEKNILLNILAIGSDAGAPIPLNQGGFLKDASGNLVVAKLDEASLGKLANAGNGRLIKMSENNSDVKALLENKFSGAKQRSNQEATLWKDEGSWFALLAIPFVLFSFRRGYYNGILL